MVRGKQPPPRGERETPVTGDEPASQPPYVCIVLHCIVLYCIVQSFIGRIVYLTNIYNDLRACMYITNVTTEPQNHRTTEPRNMSFLTGSHSYAHGTNSRGLLRDHTHSDSRSAFGISLSLSLSLSLSPRNKPTHSLPAPRYTGGGRISRLT